MLKFMWGGMVAAGCLLAAMLWPGMSMASGLPAECRTPYETIFPLRDPVFNTLQLWHSFVGEDGRDRFADALPAPDGEWVMIGDSLPAPDAVGKVRDNPDLYLAMLDARGRPQEEWRVSVPGLKRVVRAIRGPDHLYVLSAIASEKREAGLISMIPWPLPRTVVDPIAPAAGPVPADAKGPVAKAPATPPKPRTLQEMVRHITLADPEFDIRVDDLVFGEKRSALYAMTRRVDPKGAPTHFARLFVMTPKGVITHHRDYNTGLASQLHRMRVLKDGSLVAVGSIDDGRGRVQGWSTGLGPDGGLLWQEIYPRGAAAALRDVVSTGEGTFVATGDSLPQDGNPPAAWVMAFTNGGNPEWERFYTGNFIYRGIGIEVEKNDGRLTILMSGQPAQTADRRVARTHARFLTLSPNAALINDEAVSHGAGATPLRLVRDDADRRFAVGFAQSAVATRTDDVAYESLQDGWIVALPSLAAYRDPCRPRPLFGQ